MNDSNFEEYWKAKRRNQKIITGIILVILVTPILIIALRTCNYVYEASSSKVETTTNKEIVKVKWTTANQTKLNTLLKSFKTTKDDFNRITWYEHKDNPILSTNLHCVVSGTENYCYLVSMYYGDDWLFHEQVQIKFDDYVISSKIVNTFDSRNETNNSGGSVWETISFTGGDDNDIPKFISINYNKPIKVRLLGRQYHKDYLLSNKLKIAIKQSYELAEMLKMKSLAENN